MSKHLPLSPRTLIEGAMKKLLLASVCTLALTTGINAKVVEVGNAGDKTWGIFYDDSTEAGACHASTSYKSGVTVYFTTVYLKGPDNEIAWDITLLNKEWHWAKGKPSN